MIKHHIKLYINVKKKPCPSSAKYNFNFERSAKITPFPLVLLRSQYICQMESLTQVFYGDLVHVYKLRRIKDTPDFISSVSKIVKRLRRRQYDPAIIERTIYLVLGPSTAFPKALHSDYQGGGDYMNSLVQTSSEATGHDLCPLWLLVGTPLAIRPELAPRRAEHSLYYSDVAIYIFLYVIFITYAVCVLIFMTSPLDIAVGLLSI